MIGRRVRGPPLVSSCATGRRCTCAPIRRRTRRPSLALLRDARPPTGVTTPAAGTTAHLLIAVADDQCVEPAL
ncbi:MAG: hypothetical protein JWP83_2266 [Mycobacterium sp.]|jgi:hypothetical protein|nr:hypothetical protein [Mycobacterium sp.]